MTENSSTKPKTKRNGRRNNNNSKNNSTSNPGPAGASTSEYKAGSKGKEKCIHCRGDEHRKRNCAVYLAKNKDSDTIESLDSITEVKFIASTSDFQYADSVAICCRGY